MVVLLVYCIMRIREYFKNKEYMDILIIIFWLIVGWVSSSGLKSQFVRLVDIFFIGPFLITLGLGLSTYNKNILLAIGATTISYNLKNYISIL